MKTEIGQFIRRVSQKYGSEVGKACTLKLGHTRSISEAKGLSVLGQVLTEKQIHKPSTGHAGFTSMPLRATFDLRKRKLKSA